MGGIISIKFMNNQKEYGEAIRKYYSKSLHTKIDLAIEILLAVSGIVLWIYFGFSWAWILLIGASIFGVLLKCLVNYVVPALRFRQEPKFKDEYTLEFSEDGINFLTDHFSSKLDWNYYEKVWETEKFYFMFYGKKLFTLVPKRAFRDDETNNRFKQLLNKKIKAGVIKV